LDNQLNVLIKMLKIVMLQLLMLLIVKQDIS